MGAYRAIGACYWIRQIPGSERLGGLQVTIHPNVGGGGTIRVVATARRTGEELVGLIEPYVDEAIRGIREVATRHAVRLEDLDVELSEFLDHDVDSDPRCDYQAGKSAFRSALEGLRVADLSAM